MDNSLEEIKNILEKFNDGDDAISSPADVVDAVESILSEKVKNRIDTDQDAKLQKSINTFRKEQAYDYKLAGRGDMDTANEKILSAIEKYISLAK
jgi:DNA-binding transcriptional MerR regulator